MSEPSPVPTAGSPSFPSIPVVVPLMVTVAVGLLIAMGEVDRLIGMYASSERFSVTISGMSGPALPFPWPAATDYPWAAFVEVSAMDGALRLITLYLVLDCFFALFWGALLFLTLKGLLPGSSRRRTPSLPLLTRPLPWLAAFAALADVVENIGLWLMAWSASSSSVGIVVGFTVVAGSLKWLFVLWAVVQVAIVVTTTDQGRARVMAAARALNRQRFLALGFVPLAVLALVPGNGVLDQLPDVQRAWLGADRQDRIDLAVSVALLAVLTFGLFILGRLVSDTVHRRIAAEGEDADASMGAARPDAPMWLWLYIPGLVAVGAGVSLIVGIAPVREVPLGLFVAVPVAVAASSYCIKRRHSSRPPSQQWTQPAVRPYTQAHFRHVMVLGDLLVVSGVVVGSLALIRSHMVFLALHEGTRLQQMMPVLGAVTAVLAWLVLPRILTWVTDLPATSWMRWLSRLVTPGQTPGAGVDGPGLDGVTAPLRMVATFFIVVGTGLLLWLAVRPLAWAEALGVIGAVMAAIGVLSLLIGATVVLHLHYAPPRIFWAPRLRLRETPAATLLLLTIGGILVLGSSHDVHGVRGSLPQLADGQDAGGGTADARQAPAQESPYHLFRRWNQTSQSCSEQVPDDQPFRPMLLVAAEGGGIRAAYWAAAALETLGDEAGAAQGCGLASVILASGVSGGALGLTVSRFTPDGGDRSARADVWEMGGPDALAQASLGLLVRDPIYSVTGLAPGSDVQGATGWLDRAALMEVAWEQQSTGLSEQFFTPPASGTSGFAAALVLNSTETSSGCRMLISHVETASAAVSDCAGTGAPAAFSRDLAATFMTPPTAAAGAADVPDKHDRCLTSLKASTAAMLAARFPYVTPSGVVGPCWGEESMVQLIDGGYAEGSGMGTLVDLAGPLLDEVRTHNEANSDDLVLPVVVYLDNGRGSDLAAPPSSAVAEVLVPPTGRDSAGTAQREASAWLQRAEGMLHDVRVGVPATAPQGALDAWGTRVFVVAQASVPAVEAPLGWVLSDASRDDMDRSLAGEVSRACSGPGGPPTGRPGLGELIAAMRGCALPGS